MPLNAHDQIVLVAPRPVRLAASIPYTHFHNSIINRPQPRAAVRLVSAPADTFDRLKLADESVDEEQTRDSPRPPSDRDSTSPRASPRSTLPSEALEEFLSILRPTTTLLFQSGSPILRSNNANSTGPFFQYRRSPSCSISPIIPSDGSGVTFVTQDNDIDKENDTAPYPFRWLGSGHLASPVARNLTRNPFQRHPSYDTAVTAYIRDHVSSPSPSPLSISLSPAAVPLPLPTPDELDPEHAS